MKKFITILILTVILASCTAKKTAEKQSNYDKFVDTHVAEGQDTATSLPD